MWTPPACVYVCVYMAHVFSDGCPGLCSGHGRCTLEQSGWRCVCQTGWSGPGCSVVMETDCSDGADNDGGDISTIIYHFLSASLLSSLFHSRLFRQIVHYFVLLFLLPRNLPDCLSPSSLHAVPLLLRLQKRPYNIEHVCVPCSHERVDNFSVIIHQITSFYRHNFVQKQAKSRPRCFFPPLHFAHLLL